VHPVNGDADKITRRRLPKIWTTPGLIPASFSAGLLAVIHDYVLEGINEAEPDDANLTAHRDVTVKFIEAAFLEVIIWWIER